MCELARNSVIQSGFEMRVKQHWIGKKWYMPGPAGNDMQKTNVPNIRLAFRHETLKEELAMLGRYAEDNVIEASSVSQPAAGSSSVNFVDSTMIGASSLVEPSKLQQDLVHNHSLEPRPDQAEDGQKEYLEPAKDSSDIWQLSTSPSNDYKFPGASVLAQRARQRRLSQDLGQ